MSKNKLKQLKSSFKKAINLAENESYDNFYSDINYLLRTKNVIELDKTSVNINKVSDEGIKIRVWDNEKFLEYGQTNLSEEELVKQMRNLLEKAQKNQNSIKEESKVKLKVDEEIIEKDFETKASVASENVSLEEKVEKLKKIKEKVLNYSEDIMNIRVVLLDEVEENVFASKYKCLSQRITLNLIIVIAFVKSEKGMKMVYNSVVGNGLEVFDKFEKGSSKFREDIENAKKAKELKGGKYKAVLSPKLSGLLAHESFGHGMEADTMIKGRALSSKWIGERIGAENVNIVDYARIDGKHGEFFFDNEGNLAEKTYLVKNGIVQTPMTDLYTKTKLNFDSSSSSRFDSFDHKNYVRMSNTYFEAGDKTFDELVSQVDDGIFIIDSRGGMEDPKSWGVQIQGCFGQRIKNGKLVNEFYDGFALTGFLPDLMGNIKGVSQEFEIEGGGNCGKGHKEWVRVAEGGPYILVDEVILG